MFELFSTAFLRETADRALKSFLQGYVSLFFLRSGATPDLDKLFTIDNLRAGALMAVLSVITALGLRNVGDSRDTSQVL